MMMTINVEETKKNLDFNSIQRIAYALADIEKNSSYDDFAVSAEFCCETLKKAGFSDVQRITHRADGKTTVFDCTMPQAWILDRSRRSFLEVCGENLPECGRVLADSTINPLHANIWSSPTPEGGITAEVVDFDSLNGDLSAAKGKWLLYAPYGGVSLCYGLYHDFAEAGIAGLLCCNMDNADVMPNDIQWFNGNGNTGWYLLAGEKRFPTFSITPIVARSLRKQLASGAMELHGEMYCRICDGEIYTVTATIPGESSEEVALISHLYEPFVNDNAAGFAHLCEFGRQLLKRRVKLKKTLRLIFSMELYGCSAFLSEYGKNIVLAANFDGLPYLEGSDILLRRMPFCRGFFTDFLNHDMLKKYLPQTKMTNEPGNFSDDTFCNDKFFGRNGIPTFWIHHSFERSHHNTGYLFQVDWLAAKKQLPVFDAIVEKILCLEKLPDYSRRAAQEFSASARAIIQDEKLSGYEKKIYINVEYLRNLNRLRSVTSYTGQSVDRSFLGNARQKYSEKIEKLPPHEFSAAEYRAIHLTVSRGDKGYPCSLKDLPENLRHKPQLSRILWDTFDGEKNLLECIRMADAELGTHTTDEQITVMISDLQLISEYGYAALKKSPPVSADDFGAALSKLGVTAGMKLVVHSTFSSLGQVEGGAEMCCKKLQEQLGENGTLMMPAFTFQIYLPGNRNEFYDVRNTPSKVGILTETFRKMPGVYRSFDPCHSFAVWGKNAVKYVENHHLVPTIDPEKSPLGMFFAENGYVLTISSAKSVTFMHLVEEMCGARCCSKRKEEFRTILPDGREVKTRSWGWRSKTCPECPARRENEIFDMIRKKGKLNEVIFNNSCLKLFSMKDYFDAYRKLMKKYCRNRSTPRKVECTVKSDWDEKKRLLKKTDAYTGAWMPDKN